MKTAFGSHGPVALLLVGMSASCNSSELLPAPGHHVVTLDTDAVVPAAPGATLDPNAPIPLFDRLELAVLREGETEPAAEEKRDFAVDESTFLPDGATFTIEAAPGEVVRVRARLFRDASSFAGEPRPESTVEVLAELPPTPTEGALETTIELRTEDVGVPVGTVKRPIEIGQEDSRVVAGNSSSLEVGSWAKAQHIPCSGEPGPGETCVQGGAYWMGNPLVKGDDFVESDRQRLVVLSPYFLDTGEVKVGQLREFLARRPDLDTVPRNSDVLVSEEYFCTYTEEPEWGCPDGTPCEEGVGSNACSATDCRALSEERPANCVEWELADAYCRDRGALLPSEAQFEYASSELRSALFVWGADEAPLCEAAVWGRSGLDNSAIEQVGASNCKSLGIGPQTLSVDPKLRDSTRLTDRITIGGTEVFDLAGNLQEWVLDRYTTQDEPCWKKEFTNVFSDPVCTLEGKVGERSVRGGSWIQNREFLRAAYRASRGPDQGGTFVVGFRCARPGE